MRRAPASTDFAAWVHLLGNSSWRQRAKHHLLASGPPAVPALRNGLRHPKPMVRRQVTAILDHLLDEDAVPDLVAALDDEDPGVCTRALHALACDACKQNGCRPADDLFVPRALEFVRSHPDPDVRAAAIDAVARAAGRRPELAPILLDAVEREPDRGLRNLARRRTERLVARANG